MKLKDIRQKLQAVLRLKALLKRGDKDKGIDEREVIGNVKKKKKLKPSWMMPISHGYHVVEGDRSWGEASNGLEQPDNVVVQREKMLNLELWFYGVSDPTIGNHISHFTNSHFFHNNLLKESEIRKKGKETMRKAHLKARAYLKENGKLEMLVNGGSATALVINGEKLVIAQMGGHKVVVCRDAVAHQLNSTNQHTPKKHWPRTLIYGAMRITKVRMQACHNGSESGKKQMKNSELVVASENIDSDTEFIILASAGVWEEAVDLIRHINDPREAAKCLAREALSRMSKSNISCLVIRFD